MQPVSDQRTNRHKDFQAFRERHPVFRYSAYHIHSGKEGISLTYDFDAGNGIEFHPKIIIKPHKAFDLALVKTPIFENLVFHAGLIELISYWKSVCSPVISIETGALTAEQVKWWKKLYYHGLGEFFFLNGIDAKPEDFTDIRYREAASRPSPFRHQGIHDGCIVPVGGGKDSSVTLHMLRNWEAGIHTFSINPTPASVRIIESCGHDAGSIISILRSIDPLLLDLNRRNYLNGHTPFSAMLAFYSLIVATLSNSRYMVLSNESSANEPTIAGTEVNHQYSKSYMFEKDFRWYVHNHLSADLNYFSLLRPLSEYQIAGIFSSLGSFHAAFRSCNAGSKTDTWCGSCAKCLFTQVILSPFLDDAALSSIFGSKLFENEKLYPLLYQLAGISEHKPFDCVGTINEVRFALHRAIDKRSSTELPVVLKKYTNEFTYKLDGLVQAVEPHTITGTHFVPDRFLRVLNDHLWSIDWP